MAKFLEYDALRGVTQYEDVTSDGRLQVHYEQDVEPILDRTRMERNDGLTDGGIKNDMWLYARIPPVVILELKYKWGVDIFNRNHMKRAMQLINTEYPYVKCTNKVHTVNN